MVAGSNGSAGAHGKKNPHLAISVFFETQIWRQVEIARCKCYARMVACYPVSVFVESVSVVESLLLFAVICFIDFLCFSLFFLLFSSCSLSFLACALLFLVTGPEWWREVTGAQACKEKQEIIRINMKLQDIARKKRKS